MDGFKRKGGLQAGNGIGVYLRSSGKYFSPFFNGLGNEIRHQRRELCSFDIPLLYRLQRNYRFANRPNRGDHRYSHAQLQKKWREKKRNRLMEMPKVLTLKGKFTNAPVILFTYFS